MFSYDNEMHKHGQADAANTLYIRHIWGLRERPFLNNGDKLYNETQCTSLAHASCIGYKDTPELVLVSDCDEEQ